MALLPGRRAGLAGAPGEQAPSDGAPGSDSGQGSGGRVPPDGAYGAGGGGAPWDHGESGEEPRRPESAPARPAGRWGRVALLVVTALLLATVGGGIGAALTARYGWGEAAANPAVPQVSPVTAPNQQLARAAAAVLPSIVSIRVRDGSQLMIGSGVILRSDGFILTNDHVVSTAADGGGTVTVTFDDGKTAAAEVVGGDASADLAVIRAAGVPGLIPAVLGSASNLHVGDTVLAVGSPLGLVGSVSSGIVSALHRDVVVSSGSHPSARSAAGAGQQSGGTIRNGIQTDTAINPGNSGGALVDDTGKVVGITAANATVDGGGGGQQSGSIGIGFAIPIDTAYRIAVGLMS